MPDGANLRETRLDRAALIMTIKCGLPGTGMPPFDKFAYSDGRCYGLKQADLAKAGQRMSDPPATLQNREIEFLADFMFAKVDRQGPDGPRQVRGVLGTGDGGLRRVSEVGAAGIAASAPRRFYLLAARRPWPESGPPARSQDRAPALNPARTRTGSSTSPGCRT